MQIIFHFKFPAFVYVTRVWRDIVADVLQPCWQEMCNNVYNAICLITLFMVFMSFCEGNLGARCLNNASFIRVLCTGIRVLSFASIDSAKILWLYRLQALGEERKGSLNDRFYSEVVASQMSLSYGSGKSLIHLYSLCYVKNKPLQVPTSV